MKFEALEILESWVEDSRRGSYEPAREGVPVSHSWGSDGDYRELERQRKAQSNRRWVRLNPGKSAARARKWRKENEAKRIAYDVANGRRKG